jgi:rare lipoprotein A
MKVKSLVVILTLLAAFSTFVFAQRLQPQKGNASYYADYFHGRTMSNGQKYHRDSMTCAHLYYPLGTWLRVRNITNGKEVVVRVTDRGPYSRKFVIDLSRAAARQLDIIHYGWRPVEITPFTPGHVPFILAPQREKPVLNLGFSDDEDDLAPYWQEDSIYLARHRLSRTQIAVHIDTLKAAVHRDTTIRAEVEKTQTEIKEAPQEKSKKKR